jgi:hypothetical protein
MELIKEAILVWGKIHTSNNTTTSYEAQRQNFLVNIDTVELNKDRLYLTKKLEFHECFLPMQ